MRKLPYRPQGNLPIEQWAREVVGYLESLRPMTAPGTLAEHSVNGVARRAQPVISQSSLFGVSVYLFQSHHGDYVTVHSFDGTTEGGTDIYVAKPPQLRFSVTSDSRRDSKTFDNYDTTSQSRESHGPDDRVEEITAMYGGGDTDDDNLIYAVRVPYTGVTVSGNDLTLLDLNVDARAWCDVP